MQNCHPQKRYGEKRKCSSLPSSSSSQSPFSILSHFSFSWYSSAGLRKKCTRKRLDLCDVCRAHVSVVLRFCFVWNFCHVLSAANLFFGQLSPRSMHFLPLNNIEPLSRALDYIFGFFTALGGNVYFLEENRFLSFQFLFPIFFKYVEATIRSMRRRQTKGLGKWSKYCWLVIILLHVLSS